LTDRMTHTLVPTLEEAAALFGHPRPGAERTIPLAAEGEAALQAADRRLGLALAGGASLAEALDGIGQVVEGEETARVVVRLAAEHGVEMPITEQVDRVLHAGTTPADAVNALLSRAPSTEGY